MEKIEGTNLKLDSDDGEDTVQTNGTVLPKADKIKDKTKGLHNSNNAYMLVYKNQTQSKRDLDNTYEAWNLPEYLVKAIQRDNQSFEASIAELKRQKVIIFNCFISD